MTLLSLALKPAFLTSVLLALIGGPTFSKTTEAKNRPVQQPENRRTTPTTGRTKSSTPPRKHVSAKETQVAKQRQVFPTKRLVENRSSKSSKAQLRFEEHKRLEAKRRAEAARAAYVRDVQRARDEELRDRVQSMIAKDDLTGEDPEVRRAAVNALGNHAGTVVVMNPQTGRIYSMVNQQWALHEGFKPCSTIKLLTGLAGLNENVIDPTDTTKISDNNQVGLTRALAYSKNEYFQQVGQQVGFDKMVSYARWLGLGEKTGINAQNEFQGSVPGPASRFAQSRMWSHGDNFQVTPIQLATLVSAMANGGQLLTPRITRTKQEEINLKAKVRRQVKLDADTWSQMIPGMVGSVSYGSGRKAYDPAATVAGKTGTCIEEGVWVGLFTSYAPLANPRLAVVVIARGADARNHFPAAVAGQIYRDLNPRFGTPANLQIAATRKPLTSAEKAQTDVDDEEEDESTAVSKSWNEANNIGGINRTHGTQPLTRTAGRPADSKVKTVLMPIPRRNPEAVKPTGNPTGTPATGPEPETRPRRVLGER